MKDQENNHEGSGLSVVVEQLVQVNDKLAKIIELLLEKAAAGSNEYEPLMDNQDVCFELGISKRTLQRYRQKNIIPFYVLEKKPYYKKSEILAFPRTYIRNSKHRKE